MVSAVKAAAYGVGAGALATVIYFATRPQQGSSDLYGDPPGVSPGDPNSPSPYAGAGGFGTFASWFDELTGGSLSEFGSWLGGILSGDSNPVAPTYDPTSDVVIQSNAQSVAGNAQQTLGFSNTNWVKANFMQGTKIDPAQASAWLAANYDSQGNYIG